LKKIPEAGSEEKIRKAALKEFAEHGFEGARVDRIAAKAKINKAMIYYHHKNKESLYEMILGEIAEMIFQNLNKASTGDGEPLERLRILIERYIELLNVIDRNVIRTLIRELASGGKYFKKVILPKLFIPVVQIVFPMFDEAKKKKQISDIDPLLTMIQMIGSIVFFNIMRITLEGTPVHEMIEKSGGAEGFRKNFMKILDGALNLNGGGK
jgi:TetR/AcrR family transcriptional regulator